MGLVELPLIIAGWILSAAIAGVGGAFALQGRNNKRVETIRDMSDKKIEKLIETNDHKIEVLIAANSVQNENVLAHIQNVEDRKSVV